MQTETQFSIFLINKPGVLAAVTEELAKAKVNIKALALMDSGEHGALRLVAEDAEKTRKIMMKTAKTIFVCAPGGSVIGPAAARAL